MLARHLPAFRPGQTVAGPLRRNCVEMTIFAMHDGIVQGMRWPRRLPEAERSGRPPGSLRDTIICIVVVSAMREDRCSECTPAAGRWLICMDVQRSRPLWPGSSRPVSSCRPLEAEFRKGGNDTSKDDDNE